jgi:hypothetical protein
MPGRIDPSGLAAGDLCGEGTMIRRCCLLTVFALLTSVPSLATARGYGRSGGTLNTPFGTINMNSPEYKMSGGNPIVYQQLMEQKMLMQQQQMMLKQQQQYMKQMQKQAKNQKGKDIPQPVSNVTSLAPRKKKKKSITAAKSATAPASKTASITTSTEGTKDLSKKADAKP